MKIRPASLALLLAAGIVVAALAEIVTGSVSLNPPLVGRIVLHTLFPDQVVRDWPPGLERIVVDLRLPRVILAILTGAGLACTGVVLQAVTRNPLADPYLFGVSAGASVGAVIVIVHLGDVAGSVTLPIAAFLGAMLSLLLVISVAAGSGGFGRDRLVLAGVAVSFVLMALTNFLIFSGDQRAADSVVFWTMGGLGLARWSLFAAADGRRRRWADPGATRRTPSRRADAGRSRRRQPRNRGGAPALGRCSRSARC